MGQRFEDRQLALVHQGGRDLGRILKQQPSATQAYHSREPVHKRDRDSSRLGDEQQNSGEPRGQKHSSNMTPLPMFKSHSNGNIVGGTMDSGVNINDAAIRADIDYEASKNEVPAKGNYRNKMNIGKESFKEDISKDYVERDAPYSRTENEHSGRNETRGPGGEPEPDRSEAGISGSSQDRKQKNCCYFL